VVGHRPEPGDLLHILEARPASRPRRPAR
jgi:hypothetical protein